MNLLLNEVDCQVNPCEICCNFDKHLERANISHSEYLQRFTFVCSWERQGNASSRYAKSDHAAPYAWGKESCIYQKDYSF